MKLHRLIVASCLGLPVAVACTIDNGTGTPDPGQYWEWVCPDGGTPLEASTPIDYVAAGSCGKGGPFTLSVDGCEMFGTWSALGLSNVQTATYTSSPGLGGWSIIAIQGSADGGASWSCTARPATGGDLTFTCSEFAEDAMSATTCQSTLAPLTADGGTN